MCNKKQAQYAFPPPLNILYSSILLFLYFSLENIFF